MVVKIYGGNDESDRETGVEERYIKIFTAP